MVAPVLLGLRDVAAPFGSHRGGLPPHGPPSKLGGAPDHVPSVTLGHPTCGICTSDLAHLVQISCPLDGSPFHRVLYVFACARKGCCGKSESWKVLRSQYLEVQTKRTQDQNFKQKEECVATASDWCEGADDWGDGDEMASSGHMADQSLNLHDKSSRPPRQLDCTSQFQDLTLGEVQAVSHPLDLCMPTEEEPATASCLPFFQPYYISVVDEEDYRDYEDNMAHAQKLLKEYQQREGLDVEESASESYASEKYEKSEAEERDHVFHKFMKRIAVCREQILRYSWGGQPLFITCPPTDIKTMVPPCSQCGSRRVFEFQLMPALVSMLKTKEKDLSVEFGTALVYTCEKSCWAADQSTPFEEFIFVQEDPDQKFFK